MGYRLPPDLLKPKRLPRILAGVLLLMLGLSLGLVVNASVADPAASPPPNRPDETAVPCGPLPGSTTWTFIGSPYLITCDVIVPAGAILSIEPGVVVNFEGHSLQVLGTLDAIGTDGFPITFTGATKQQGAWDGIIFGSNNPDAPLLTGSVLSHVIVEYGGYAGGSNIQLYRAQVIVDHARISYADGPGVRGNDADAWADISDTSFDHNRGYAVELRSGAVNPVFARLTATANGYDPGSSTSDPEYDAIYTLGGTLQGQHVWEAAGVPYIFGNITVAEGSQLTVQPGVEARFTGAIGLDVEGTISAVGTSDKPILFTGVEKTPGYWIGVGLWGTETRLNSGSLFDYVTIEYGAYPNGDGNLSLQYASATVRHSVFRNSGKFGLATGLGAWVDIADSAFTGNTLGAMYFRDASVDQKLASLTIQNNAAGKDIVMLGGGTIHGNIAWEALPAGIPYVAEGSIDVASGGTLTIAPGVEVQFAGATRGLGALNDGRLIAAGTAQQPIKFTGTTKTPGSWDGIYFSGSNDTPNLDSLLRYVTIEYGGYSGGNIYMENAYPRISHCVIRSSSSHGIFGRIAAGPRVSDTAINDNAGYAIYLRDAGYKPEFAHVTAAGNGGVTNDKNVIAFDFGALHGENLWPNVGLPYHLLGDLSIQPDGQLTIEPGVEARFANGHGLSVYGRLLALGTEQQPIKLTRLPESAGWWSGIHFEGYEDAPSTGSRLEYVTVEYGGNDGYGNISANWAQVAIAHSIIRDGAYSGVYVLLGGDMVSIQASQITGNAGYGVYNHDPHHTTVSARNNWWGAASGPTYASECNGGSGSPISDGVDFLPFLTSAGANVSPLTPSAPYFLTIEPDRWYVPADGVIPAVIVATVRDGDGKPAAGHKILASTSIGDVEAGGITDVTGKTHIYVTSTQSGEADVRAWIDQGPAPCPLIREASTSITFTSEEIGGPLAPGAEAPYISGDLVIGPQPVMRGVPLMVRATLRNPYDYALRVNAIVGIAQSGIGLAFPPIMEWQGQQIPPHSTLMLSAPYTPLVEGHFCFKFGYSWSLTSAAGVLEDCGWDAKCNWRAFLGLNTDAAPAATFNDRMRDAFKNEGEKKRNWNNFGEDTSPDNKNEADKGFNLDWRSKIDVTREFNEGMSKDPPRQDYTLIATPQRPPLKTYQAGEDGLSAAQATAINTLLDVLTDAIALGRAILISEDRYAGAVEVGDLTWMSQQTAAILYYRQQLGAAYVRVADAAAAWLAIYPGNIVPTYTDVIAAQTRLATTGFTTEEIARYQALGATAAEIEALRQAYITAVPADKVITMRQELADIAAGYRELGSLLINPPPTFSQQVGGGLSAVGMAAAPTDANLAAIYDVERIIQVGNPLTTTATIDLSVRRLGMPADWAVTISPTTLPNLAPGQSQPVTVRISPASTAVQGTTARVAVEGFAGTQLLGGVEFKVAIPSYVPFRQKRVYLPMIRR